MSAYVMASPLGSGMRICVTCLIPGVKRMAFGETECRARQAGVSTAGVRLAFLRYRLFPGQPVTQIRMPDPSLLGGLQREAGVGPAPEPAPEDAHGLVAAVAELLRHTGARRLVRSGAVGDDGPGGIHLHGGPSLLQGVGRDVGRARDLERRRLGRGFLSDVE